jgi:ribosome-binding protein aMBF1 (putative translation factor)
MDYKLAIKSYMHNRGMTQGQFASLIGADPHTITRWMHGRSKPRGYYKREVDRLLEIGE